MKTDEYEGHRPAPWRWFGKILVVDADNRGLPFFEIDKNLDSETYRPDRHLIADAPKLFAEVKRLQLVEMTVQDFLDEKIDTLEFCRNMRDMGVIE